MKDGVAIIYDCFIRAISLTCLLEEEQKQEIITRLQGPNHDSETALVREAFIEYIKAGC